MSRDSRVGRRDVLKTVGGATAMSLAGGLASGTGLAAHNDSNKAIRVNQTGYSADGRKMAIVTDQVADLGSLSSFEVVDVDSGTSVHSGTLSSAADDGWLASNHSVKHAVFTELSASGTYKVVAGNHESHPFKIGSGTEVYGDALLNVGRLYTLKRANADIQDPVTGLDIGPGHVGPNGDDNATIAAPASGDWLEDYSAGEEIDVTGGWYDAGDYGKYVITTGITAAELMTAYDRNPDAFTTNQWQIPDSIDDPNVGSMPDVLAEAKYGLQFLKKMQRPNGSLFYKVAAKDWPGMSTAPSDDNMERFVFGCSSAGTAHGAGAFALAARIFQDVDPDFASEMEQAARDAWSWLSNNPDVVFQMSDSQDGGSGGYGRRDGDGADRYWAAAELYRTTGEQQYLDAVQSGYETTIGGTNYTLPSADAASPIDWTNPLHLGNRALSNTSEFSGTDSAPVGGLKSSFWVGQRYLPSYETYDAYTTGLYAFYWGAAKSGVSRAVTGHWGMEKGPDWMSSEAHAPMLWGPVHYVMGRSPTGYSYVTTHGEESTQNPHDRIVQSQGQLIPGMLVGGPHQELYSGLGSDCSSDHVPQGTAPGMSYTDQHCSYATNEWAINYTAPLFMALAELVDGAPSMGDGENTPTDTPEGGPSFPQGATDPDGDELYEDLTGNGQIDNQDVVTFFQNMGTQSNPGRLAQNGNLQYYDFSGNNQIDYQDLISLFNEIPV